MHIGSFYHWQSAVTRDVQRADFASLICIIILSVSKSVTIVSCQGVLLVHFCTVGIYDPLIFDD